MVTMNIGKKYRRLSVQTIGQADSDYPPFILHTRIVLWKLVAQWVTNFLTCR